MPEHTIAENLTRLQNAKTDIGSAIIAKGGSVAAGDGLEEFAADIGTITNQYTPADEGKVVSNGALVAQTAYPSTITENGTYNTTENNSVTVNVPVKTGHIIFINKSGLSTQNEYVIRINNTIIYSALIIWDGVYKFSQSNIGISGLYQDGDTFNSDPTQNGYSTIIQYDTLSFSGEKRQTSPYTLYDSSIFRLVNTAEVQTTGIYQYLLQGIILLNN